MANVGNPLAAAANSRLADQQPDFQARLDALKSQTQGGFRVPETGSRLSILGQLGIVPTVQQGQRDAGEIFLTKVRDLLGQGVNPRVVLLKALQTPEGINAAVNAPQAFTGALQIIQGAQPRQVVAGNSILQENLDTGQYAEVGRAPDKVARIAGYEEIARDESQPKAKRDNAKRQAELLLKTLPRDPNGRLTGLNAIYLRAAGAKIPDDANNMNSITKEEAQKAVSLLKQSTSAGRGPTAGDFFIAAAGKKSGTAADTVGPKVAGIIAVAMGRNDPTSINTAMMQMIASKEGLPSGAQPKSLEELVNMIQQASGSVPPPTAIPNPHVPTATPDTPEAAPSPPTANPGATAPSQGQQPTVPQTTGAEDTTLTPDEISRLGPDDALALYERNKDQPHKLNADQWRALLGKLKFEQNRALAPQIGQPGSSGGPQLNVSP